MRAAPVDAALSTAFDTDDPERVAAIVALLDELARHVTPQALTRLRE